MDKKKIDKLDAKIKKIKLPRGEGSISWARKDSCLVQYKKTIKFPDGTTKRISVTAHDIEPLYVLMKEKEQEEKTGWKDNSTIKSDTKFSDITLKEAIEKWFYKFKYINKKERSFDREECTLKNQILAYSSFSNLQMHVIDDIKIQDHITMIASKHSYSTTKKAYELLNQFFKYYYDLLDKEYTQTFDDDGIIIYFSGVIVLINAILEVKEEKYLYNNKKENEKNDSNKN